METLKRITAGTNERLVKALIERAPDVKLLGKRRFSAGDVEISVDESLEYRGVEYLIEVDSANMAKLLVGQYVLLNVLHTSRAKPPFFLVIHTYKNYNPSRTLHNLELVNRKLYEGNGIDFGAVHFTELSDWQGDFGALLNRVHRPKRLGSTASVCGEPAAARAPGGPKP
jgi:hypothetical protein